VATGLAIVEDEVRELIRRRGINPVAEVETVSRLIDEVTADYLDRSVNAALPPLGDLPALTRSLRDAVCGFGPLQPYLDDPSVEEIWINEPGRVFIARRGRSELTTTILSADQVAELVERMLRSSGRRIDMSSPFVDAMLPDGSRLHVVIPQITRAHMAVNIRKFVVTVNSLAALVNRGSLTDQAAHFLEASVVAGLNILVAGGTQAGATHDVVARAPSALSRRAHVQVGLWATTSARWARELARWPGGNGGNPMRSLVASVAADQS
jgi:pilus assembly protein CpaF